jgi:hypothetical protein
MLNADEPAAGSTRFHRLMHLADVTSPPEAAGNAMYATAVHWFRVPVVFVCLEVGAPI